MKNSIKITIKARTIAIMTFNIPNLDLIVGNKN